MITIKGQVGEGRKIGRTIGYPTINISYGGKERGIFAGKVMIENKFILAAIHLGPRPTFEDKQPVCEAFLLDWDKDIPAGELVEIEAHEKIREIQKFKNLVDLKDQISRDVEFVKNWYNSTNK